MSAVITGVAPIAPNGMGVDQFWSSTLAGSNGIGPVTSYDSSRYRVKLAGEIKDFDAEAFLSRRMLPMTDRATRLSLVASDWALADAGIDASNLEEFRSGVVTGSSAGGHEFGQRELQKLCGLGPEYVSAYQSFAWFYAVNTGQISIRHGLRGASGVFVSEQCGGLDALAQARRLIRDGMTTMVAGSVEASLCPWGIVAQLANGRLSQETDPSRAYVPFDTAACGYVPGEGGALLIVEAADHAERRGADIYGELAGYGSTFDPAPATGRPPRLRAAIELALADAGMCPADLDVVFADASGVPALDREEADAITAVFGRREVAVTAPKTMTGRLYSGGAALDVVSALLALRDGVIPPTINTVQLGVGIDIDLVHQPRYGPLTSALVLARGYGGFNSALIIRSCKPTNKGEPT